MRKKAARGQAPAPPLELDPALNAWPERLLPGQGRLCLLGIGGVAMAALAGLLSDRGYRVTGADQGVYPPASHLLEELGLPVFSGYGPECLEEGVDLAVVGNAVTRAFPVAAALKERAIPYLSFPQVMEGLFLSRTRNLVVAGCHGKTTVTNLAAFLLSQGGMRPGFLLGGASLDFPRPYREAGGDWFVIEGDEYDCAFFDKGPKFLHYRPQAVILTSVEFDHADIYRDLEAVKAAYARLMALVPADGLVIANGDDPQARETALKSRSEVIFYGQGERCQYRVRDFRADGFLSTFRLEGPDGLRLELCQERPGLYNALNAAAASLAYLRAGGEAALLPSSLRLAKGVRRRQERVLDLDSFLLVDDFAHHPTAVARTLEGLREAFPGRRLVALFEPRSNTSRRAVFQEDYARSFRAADAVWLSAVDRPEKAPEGDRLDAARLAAEIGGRLFQGPEEIFRAALSEARAGDVMVTLSNGSFGNLASRLAEALGGRFSGLRGPGESRPGSGQAYFPPFGYAFRQKALLEAALTHRSALGGPEGERAGEGVPAGRDSQKSGAGGEGPAADPGESDYQRLEFLGDAVVDLFVGQMLFSLRPRLDEGRLSRLRASLVCEPSLAGLARGLGLGQYVRLSYSEIQSGARERPSILADLLEALLGAVFLDGGPEEARAMVERIFSPLITDPEEMEAASQDWKSRLQEYSQGLALGLPIYELVGYQGPSNSSLFTMSVRLGGSEPHLASGRTKKEAEQSAARSLWQSLTARSPQEK